MLLIAGVIPDWERVSCEDGRGGCVLLELALLGVIGGDYRGGSIPQDAGPASASQDITLEEVVVARRRGATVMAPEVEYDAAGIDDLGAYDIAETITLIGQRLGLEEPPTIIVNGRRVVNAGDFMRFAPDALTRVELLPPEAATAFGEPPSRRIVNIVLRPEYRSRDARLRGGRPTGGGRSLLAADARQGEILNSDTRQFGLKLSRETALVAGERPAVDGAAAGGGAVTLRPEARFFEINAASNQTFGDWAVALGGEASGGNGRFVSLVGGQPVETFQDRRRLNLSGGLTGEVLGWSTRFSLRGDVTEVDQTGIADVSSRTVSGGSDLSLNRSLIDLPAGPVTASLAARYQGSWSRQRRSGIETDRDVQDISVRGGLLIPLSELGDDRVPGAFSLTLGGAASGLLNDDGGWNLNSGLSWSPQRKVRLGVQWSRAVDSPSLADRLDPIYYGAPQRVYDFATGQTVEVLPLYGGNPDLGPESSDRVAVSMSAGPFFPWRLFGRLSFQSQRSVDGIGAVPELSPIVEAAFPDRFIRDAQGRLTVVDRRALNLGRARSETISTGLSFNLPPGSGAGQGGRATPWQVNLNHTWRLVSETALGPGLAHLDQIRDGGLPEHQANLQVSGKIRRVSVSASLDWRGQSRIRRLPGQDGPDDLVLEPLTRVDLKLSYDLGPSGRTPLQGERRRYDALRLELELDNLFDTRPEALRGDGAAAPGFGRDVRDPVGRQVRVSVSRRF